MKIKANICISRDSSNMMRVKVQDEASHATFLEMEFTPHDLMMALTGLSHVDATVAEVRGLDVVGKQKIIERRSVKYPGSDYDSCAVKEKWLAENCKEDGWIVAPYLRSQTSISHRDGETILHYSVYRYEEQEQSHVQ